jgi:putative Mg2+ transporter-C (MgtC) family protein
MRDLSDVALRLRTASIIGAGFGQSRDLYGKRTGVRTLGLVGFGSAFIVITVSQAGTADASWVVQAIVTEIGLLGTEVIARSNSHYWVHGITTAACIWSTVCIRAAPGVTDWRTILILISLPIALVLLTFDGPAERAFQRCWLSPLKRSDHSETPNTEVPGPASRPL